MAAFEKTMFVSNGQGTLLPRPPKMDIKPKAFPFPASHMLALFEVPSERRMLWMIYHYPYMLNTFFISDLVRQNSVAGTNPESKLNKALLVAHSLRMKGLIKDCPHGTFKIKLTWAGYFFRLTSHPAWPAVGPALTTIGIMTAITIAIIVNRGCHKTPIPANKSDLPPLSSPDTHSQTPVLIKKDSVVSLSDTTKNRDTISPSSYSKHIKQIKK